jgi:uncharacterized protein (DUF2141 family)
MNKVIRLKSVLLIALLSFIINSAFLEDHELNIVIANIGEIKGNIHIGIYNKKEDFPEKGKEFRIGVFKVVSDSMKITFKVPKGKYAVALFHDINDDQKCNLNAFGIPMERFGFSNNVKVKLAVPPFDDVAVKICNDTTIYIRLIQIL